MLIQSCYLLEVHSTGVYSDVFHGRVYVRLFIQVCNLAHTGQYKNYSNNNT